MSFIILRQKFSILEVCHKKTWLLTRESYHNFTHSGLSQGTYLTSKHNHFKERRD